MRPVMRMAVALSGAAIAVSGCTNTREDASLLSLTQQAVQTFRAQNQTTPPTTAQVDAAVSQALASTDQPLALLRVDRNGNVALLAQIEQNGPYRTWAALGSSERRSITSRSGVVTATRGLGGDLMSTSLSALLDQVTRRAPGRADPVLRHLSGEATTQETRATCQITPGARTTYRQGALSQEVTRVDAACTSEEVSFENHYLVNASGRIVEARQWLGPVVGMVTFQALR